MHGPQVKGRQECVCCGEFRRRWLQRGVHKALVISRRPTLIASIQLR
jgi:hypothetical protein